MQKNSICIETQKRYLGRILYFNCQNLMFINLPNDWAIQLIAFIETIPLHIKNSMRCAILVAATSGRPTPKICFLLG